MFSIRPRTRPAVSGLAFQIGWSAAKNMLSPDGANRHVAEMRIGIRSERGAPLGPVLVVAPAIFMQGDIGLCHHPE